MHISFTKNSNGFAFKLATTSTNVNQNEESNEDESDVEVFNINNEFNLSSFCTRSILEFSTELLVESKQLKDNKDYKTTYINGCLESKNEDHCLLFIGGENQEIDSIKYNINEGHTKLQISDVNKDSKPDYLRVITVFSHDLSKFNLTQVYKISQ